MLFRVGIVVFASALMASSVFSQRLPGSQRRQVINIEGEIQAVDTFSAEVYLESRPPTKYFLVKVTRLLSGLESEGLILVINSPSSNRYPFVQAVGEKKRLFQMKLYRTGACDTSTGEIGTKYLNSQANGPISPFMWLKEEVALSDSKRLHCYSLLDENFKVL